jgi:hypothetical protein
MLRTSLLIWFTSLLPGHKIASIMQCIEPISDVPFPNTDLINDKMHVSCFSIAVHSKQTHTKHNTRKYKSLQDIKVDRWNHILKTETTKREAKQFPSTTNLRTSQ